jgi:FKBP-type peptidyl-prolyl cis-trans isomerase 2
MRSVKKAFYKGSASLPLIALALAGCAAGEAGRVIKAGDEVNIHFTCRMPNGEVAATTHKSIADDKSQAKSSIFLPVKNDEPITVAAGGKNGVAPVSSPGFEDEILRQLAKAAVGMREGEEGTITLTAETVAVRGGKDQKLETVRHRRRPKEIRIPRAAYKEKMKKEPEVGKEFAVERGFTGKIKALTDKEMIITVTAVPGTTLPSPFGTWTIRDKGDDYDMELDVKKGALVRSSELVGRVSEVGADKFVIDYSNSFAGENLNCTFSAVGITRTSEQIKTENNAGVTNETGADPAVVAKTGASANQEISRGEEERIKAAVTDAIKSGKSSVDLDLSSLSGQAEKGDLVTVRFTAENPDGSPLQLPEGFAKQETPQEVMAGKDELFPGVGEAVVGMAAGEKKQVTLPPEKAFGPRDESKTAKYPRKNNFPLSITLPAYEYVKRFGGFPVPDKEVPFIRYLKAKVTRIGEKDVTLAITAQDGARFDEPIGTVTTSVGKDSITLDLAPKLGAPFNADNRQGVITASDNETFTVDSNNPLAGKSILLNLEVVSLTKAASIQTKPIDWIEELDAGLAKAKQEGKPVFMILYADWCGFCKKTFAETLPDPRIKGMRDKFVWVKVNSDKEKKYYEQYGQKGYPLIVLLKADGTVIKKIDGYRDARALKGELEAVKL